MQTASFSKAGLKGLLNAVDGEVAAGSLPGAVIQIWHRGQLVCSEAVGWRDPESRAAMQSNTLFRIFSMTKPLTSLAAMMLVEEGAVALDAPVARFLPDFSHRQIRVIDLLQHTSGLVYGPRATDHRVRQSYADQGLCVNPRYLKPTDLVSSLSRVALVCAPGTSWQYGNSTDLLGRLIETVTGERLGSFMSRRIYVPLAMRDTAFVVPKLDSHRIARTWAHDPVDGTIPADPDQTFDATVLPPFEAGGAGLISTAWDYARFGQFMLNGGVLDGCRLVQTATARAMTSDHLTERQIPTSPGPGESALNAAGYGFGFGFAVRLANQPSNLPGSPGSFMWSGTAGTLFWADPVRNFFVVFMSQAPGARRVQHRRLIIENVYRALGS